jgi:sugar-phosphatase
VSPDPWSPAAILADLDGTLVDSLASGHRAWSAFAARHGLDPEETVKFAMGRPTRESIAALAPDSDRASERALLDATEVGDAASVVAYPGAAELLAGPIPVAIVTSGSTALATARLAGAGLEAPPVLISADAVERGKPDPEPFLLGAGALGAAPERCLAIEDAPSGIAAARAAGIPVLALRTTHPDADLDGADFVLDSLADALARLGIAGAPGRSS